jgi:hypothetical protein
VPGLNKNTCRLNPLFKYELANRYLGGCERTSVLVLAQWLSSCDYRAIATIRLCRFRLFIIDEQWYWAPSRVRHLVMSTIGDFFNKGNTAQFFNAGGRHCV